MEQQATGRERDNVRMSADRWQQMCRNLAQVASESDQQSEFHIILEIREIPGASKNIRAAIKYTAAEDQLS